MSIPEMAVYPHSKGTSVLVPQPLGNRRNIHPLFNARCSKEMAQVVNTNVRKPQADTGIRKSFPWVLNNEHGGCCGQVVLCFFHPLNHLPQRWIDIQYPSLDCMFNRRDRYGVCPNITPYQAPGFFNPETRVGQKCHHVCCWGIKTLFPVLSQYRSTPDFFHNPDKFFFSRDEEFSRFQAQSFQFGGRVRDCVPGVREHGKYFPHCTKSSIGRSWRTTLCFLGPP